MSSTGLRPMRSEMRPHTGEKMNCISEKIEKRIPITAPRASGEKSVRYSPACRGITGSTMPKPSRSMKTTSQTIPIAA